MQTAYMIAEQGPHTAAHSHLRCPVSDAPLYIHCSECSAHEWEVQIWPRSKGMKQEHEDGGQQYLQELEHCRKVCLLGEAGLLQVVELVQATAGDLLLTYIFRHHAMQT